MHDEALESLPTERPLPTSLVRSSLRRRISTLRSFYRWAIRLRHRRDSINPVREGVHGQERGLISVPQSIPWIPDERKWKAILKYVLTKLSVRDQTIVLLAHDGALRREEIVRLRVDDIDQQTHTIAIRAEITKNHMPGIIVLSHPTWTRLHEYIAEDRAALVLAYGTEANGPIFLSDSHRNPGQPLTKWTIKDIFDRISSDLHIPQLTPHKMRHLMLTELKRSGMDLLDVSRYARHRRIASTEIYLHTDLSDLARQINNAHRHIEILLMRIEEEDMTTNPNVSHVVPVWHMPIALENYPDSDPYVTDEEAALLIFYATETNGVTGGLAVVTLAKLERFDQPFRDALRLHTKYDRVTAISRRHLFKHMAQTRTAFWSWSSDIWNKVIQTTTGGKTPQ